jgi:erythronate-4-phosphate dehydrogenase
MKVVADNRIPYLKGVLEKYAEVVYLPGAEINSSDVLDTDVLIVRTRTKVNEKLLKNSKIKLVVTATIGHDHIDKNYLKERAIEWVNCPGCNSGSVATYIASLLATLIDDYKFEPSGKIFGLIGCGNVGKRVKLVAEAMGMKVLVNDPPRAKKELDDEFYSLDDVLKSADIISIHVPFYRSGEYKTENLIDDNKLKLMKENSWIINSSRGGIIVERDLEKYLIKNQINAVLDVWDNEPEINLSLMNNCKVISSHIAGYSVDGKANGTSMSVRHISKFFKLNLDNWQAFNLPRSREIIQVEEGLSGLTAALKCAYNLKDDDSNLRNHPENFEQNRGNYEPHRDLANYIFKGDKLNTQILKNMMPKPVIGE